MKPRVLIPTLLCSILLGGGCERKPSRESPPQDRVKLPAYLRVNVTMDAISVDDALLRSAYPEQFEATSENAPSTSRHVLSLQRGRITAIEHDRTSHEIAPLSKLLDEEKKKLAALGKTNPDVLEHLLVEIDPEVPHQTVASVVWTSRHRGGQFNQIHFPLEADATTAAQILETTPSIFKTLAHDDRSKTEQDNIIKCLAPTIVRSPEGISMKVLLTIGPEDGVHYTRASGPREPEEVSEISSLSLENSPALRALVEPTETLDMDLGVFFGGDGFGGVSAGKPGNLILGQDTRSPPDRARRAARGVMMRALYDAEALAVRPLHNHTWIGESCPMLPAKLSREEQIERLRAMLEKIREVYPICYNATYIASREASWQEVTPILEALTRANIRFDSLYEQDERDKTCSSSLTPELYVRISKGIIEQEREERDRRRRARRQKRSP